jgi:phosphotriesterase-related protein
MIKVVTDEEGITEDVARVMRAAAEAHRRTGVTVTTHSRPALRNGLEQLAFLRATGVPPERIVIGHSGDTEDLDYLRRLMDEGATLGMDRFGMEHVLPDDRRVATVLALLRLGVRGPDGPVARRGLLQPDAPAVLARGPCRPRAAAHAAG